MTTKASCYHIEDSLATYFHWLTQNRKNQSKHETLRSYTATKEADLVAPLNLKLEEKVTAGISVDFWASCVSLKVNRAMRNWKNNLSRLSDCAQFKYF